MSRPFLVHMLLSSPVALGEGHKVPLTMLDGLLSYCVACETFGPGAGRRNLMGSDKLVELPLPLDEILPGVYAASQGYAVMSYATLNMLVKRFDFHDKVHKRSHGVWDSKAMPESKFTNAIVPLSAVHAIEVAFFGRGDLDEVLRLLRTHIEFIGHKRAAGYGHVTNIFGAYTNEDLSWSRLDSDGNVRLHRPIPVDMDLTRAIETAYGSLVAARWRKSADTATRATLAWKAPYYLPEHHALCYEPDTYGLLDKAPPLPTQSQEDDDTIPPDDTEEEEEY